MKIRITFDFDERVHRAISAQVGGKRPATHAECEAWIHMCVNSVLDDVCHDYDTAEKAETAQEE